MGGEAVRLDREKRRVCFESEDGGSLEVSYTNMGDPYREGIAVALEDGDQFSYLFIEKDEAKQLRDLLNHLYPLEERKVGD